MPSSPSYIAIANNDSDIELLSCKPAETVTDYPHVLSDSKPTPKILSLVDEWDEISGNHVSHFYRSYYPNLF